MALDRTSVDSLGPVKATGPAGSLKAGKMHLGLADADPTAYVLVFKDGVRMIYLPTRQRTGN